MRMLPLALLLCAAPALVLVSADPTHAQTSERPTPVPPAPEPPKSMVETVLQHVQVYGLLNPRVIVASAAVESYGQPNTTAIVAAGNPVTSVRYEDPRFSFQAGQSRFGIWAGKGTALRAHIEFDFVDFSKSTPTVQSNPRVRIANVLWDAAPGFTIALGQDWDIVQPINPHGINWVGGSFQAGNTAFMRQQLQMFYKVGDIEVAAAAGFPNNNATNQDNLLELGLIPTGALRLQYSLGKMGRVGVSGIGTSLLAVPGDDQLRTFAGLAGAFGELNLGPLNLRFEGYVGQNTANLFLLGIGSFRVQEGAVVEVAEAGGFLSFKLGVLPDFFSVYGTAGIAAALEPSRVAARSQGGGTAMKRNHDARLGVDFKIMKNFSFLLEGFYHATLYQLTDEERAGVDADVTALGAESGFIITF